jgi:hypothetical protein
MKECVLVAPYGSSVNGSRDAHSLTVVVGEDSRAQTVRGVVCKLNALLLGRELGGDNDGTENLACQLLLNSRQLTSSLTTFISALTSERMVG